MAKRTDLRKPQRRLPSTGNSSESRLSSLFSIVDWVLVIGNHLYDWLGLLVLAFVGSLLTFSAFILLTRPDSPLWRSLSLAYRSTPHAVWMLMPLVGIGIFTVCWLVDQYERRNQRPRSRGRQLLTPDEAQRRTLGKPDPSQLRPRRFRDRM